MGPTVLLGMPHDIAPLRCLYMMASTAAALSPRRYLEALVVVVAL